MLPRACRAEWTEPSSDASSTASPPESTPGPAGRRPQMTRIRALAGDITTIRADAIVNAANSRLAGGGGVDGAIHQAGGPSILAECSTWVRANGPLPTGEAMVTGAGNLPSKRVIHTVGPIWGDQDLETSHRLLVACYRTSLDLAARSGSRSIAFPNISTGVYGFPKWLAAVVAVGAVREWVGQSPSSLDEVIFVSFNEENERLYSELL